MKNNQKFDILIHAKKNLSEPIINNIAEMIFNKLPHRDENCSIILSHYSEKFVEINFKKFRYITASLMEGLNKKNIKPGDTVLLGTFSVNSEFIITLMFTALVTYGVRVLLPMFVETSEIDSWIQKTNCKYIIIPKKEILALKDIQREKKAVKKVIDTAQKNNVTTFDLDDDFDIRSFIHQSVPEDFSIDNNKLVKHALKNTNLETESVIFTTSGTSGKSKLLVYEQGAFIRNCISWQESGFYEKNRLGGRNFLDIFPHTISVRTFFNAIWTGFPICIVTSDWLKRKPEKILPFLIEMKLESMTGAPAHINTIIDFIGLFPELKDNVFSELKTVVSTGAPFNESTAKRYRDTTGLILHNAYGTSETQQVLSTLLCSENELEQSNMPMGKPLNGVVIGLTKFDDDSYKLYAKSPFGHKYIIDEYSGEKIIPDEYYYIGDIVKLDENNNIFYVGREKTDFFKGSFGAKVPISYIKNYYKTLYDYTLQIEYFSPEISTLSQGLAALIFIEEDTIPFGKVINKKIINKYARIINKINNSLLEKLEPFEYEHRTISRFLLINSNLKKSFKGTLPKNEIETKFKKEIDELIKSNDQKSGVKIMHSPRTIFTILLNRFLPMKNPIFRKFILGLYLWNKKTK